MIPPTIPTLPSVSESQERLPKDIAEDALRKYFLLTDEDMIEVERCRGSGNRLGFAVQLCTLRWRGHFLPDTRSLPQPVLEMLGSQLGVLAMPIPDYPQNEKTRWEHLERIRRHLGFSKCDEAQRERLFAHLCSQAVMTPRTQALSAEACRWLIERRVVRPGQTTLHEIVGAAKEAALQQVYEQISSALNAIQQQLLDELLKAAPITDTATGHTTTPRSRLEQFKLLPRRESPAAMEALTTQLAEIQAVGLGNLSILQQVHSATRALLASWGYRYDVWSLRRFAAPKRYSIVLTFLQAALAETLDAIIEMQDKLITKVHNNARERREEVLRAAEQARTRAVVVLEEIGSLVVDETVPDGELRARIFARRSSDDFILAKVVTECRELRDRDDGSHLSFLISWYGYTRKYSPVLLASTPFDFTRCLALGEAVAYLKEVNQESGRRFDNSAPTEFLARRWERYVLAKGATNKGGISRPNYELALLTTLNERLKSGDITVTDSRRWADFDDYLIPEGTWERDRLQHYGLLGLPVESEEFIQRLSKHLSTITSDVDKRVPKNQALTIDAESGEFTLAALVGREESESVERLKQLIETRLPRMDLVDILIELDNETDFLRHFTSQGAYDARPQTSFHRRNVLAALIAVGCNIGPQRMAAASPGLSYRDISRIADWSFSEEALNAAVVDLVDFAASLPLSRIYGSGDTCSADGMRFYVPINVLAADYSPLLQGRGVTLLAHTSDHYLRFYQQAIPCKLREATFNLDGLIEHDTELDPKTCFTDTHGYTEVVMATAALLGFEFGAAHPRHQRSDALQNGPATALSTSRSDIDRHNSPELDQTILGRGGARDGLHSHADRLSILDSASAGFLCAAKQHPPCAGRNRPRLQDDLDSAIP